MSQFKSISDLCDVMSLVFLCTDDNTLMLTLEGTSTEYSIPCSKLAPGNSWYAQAMQDVQEIFGTSIRNADVLKTCKIWIPHRFSPDVYHCIFRIRVNDDQKKKARNVNSRYRGKTRWVNDYTLQRMLEQQSLKSPEVTQLMRMELGSKASALQEMKPDLGELYCCGPFGEFSSRALIKELSETSWDMLLGAAGFSIEIQTELYKEFLLCCFPYVYMSQQAFIKFSLNLGCTREEGPSLFRAADIRDRGGISFREFMYVIAALDPYVAHINGAAEVRSIYMFRFFDGDKDGLLSFAEFKNLNGAIYKAKKLPTDSNHFNRDVEQCFKGIVSSPKAQVTQHDFLRAIAEMKLRGTSHAFRSGRSVLNYLQSVQQSEYASPIKAVKSETKILSQMSLRKIPSKLSKIIVRDSPDQFTYELAMHTLSIMKSGSISAVDDIWGMYDSVSSSSMNQKSNALQRRTSVDYFNQKSLTNEVLRSLRYLMELNKDKVTSPDGTGYKKGSFSWGHLNCAKFARSLITVCNRARDIMESEPRLIEVSSPAYIIGDLHGNFAGLLYFEKVLWQLGPHLCPFRTIFLGDYVDRGVFGMEVAAYLFCNKIQTPNKIVLLRGNHELREIQMMFSFCTELIEKFDTELGTDVWNAINSVFDAMPFAAVLDKKVFCCHGGIPPPWLCPVVSAINSIPVPLSKPAEESALAWDLIWNDPMKQRGKQVFLPYSYFPLTPLLFMQFISIQF